PSALRPCIDRDAGSPKNLHVRRAEEGAVQRDGQWTASVRAAAPAAAARGEGGGPPPVRDLTAYQAEGCGGGTTDGRSLQVIVFGSSHGASQGPVVAPPVLPPRSVTLNSEPADVKWKEPQLLMPTAPT